MDIDTAVQISVTAQEVGITPLVRVPRFQHYHASWVLDGRAQGIVVLHMDTPEVAQQMVDQCKCPPIGHRSVVGPQPILDFQSYPVKKATFLIIMLETPEAITNVGAIAAIYGVDELLIGTNNLCMEISISG
jgi:2-keto-3-deoxy-L-rhamnonate aldolase RhmA